MKLTASVINVGCHENKPEEKQSKTGHLGSKHIPHYQLIVLKVQLKYQIFILNSYMGLFKVPTASFFQLSWCANEAEIIFSVTQTTALQVDDFQLERHLLLDGFAVHTTITAKAKITKCGMQPKARERLLRGLRWEGSTKK